MEEANYLRDRLFYQSDLLITDSEERKAFERLTIDLTLKIDFSDLDTEKILLSSYEILKSQNSSDRTITLVLSLLQGGIEIIKKTESIRKKVIEELRGELTQLAAEEEKDHELIEATETKIQILQTGVYEDVAPILKSIVGEKALQERTITTFESAFIRNEFRNHRRAKNGQAWKRWKGKLSAMFGLSGQQIAAVKAWEQDTLKSKGGKTVEELIEEIRIKAVKTAPAIIPTDVTTPKDHSSTEKNLDTAKLYEEYCKPEDRGFLQTFEPKSFALEKEKITREQRRWIYGLMLFTDDKNRKEMRKKLAEDFFRCSVEKIGAVTAYLTGGCRARASEEINEDIAVIEKYMSGTKEPQTKIDHSAESVEPAEASEAVPNPTTSAQASEIEDAPEDGEFFDYNNEIKNAWRKKIKEYIDANTAPEERANMKVLCLPGITCLEIPVYLELGFQAKNIIGVEGGHEEARKEFKENAKKYGINIFIGELEDVMTARKTPFDVVSLDFTGPMSEKNFRIFQQVPLNKKTVVIVNMMAKREKPKTKTTNDLATRLLEGLNHGKLFDNDPDEVTARFQNVFKDQEKKELSESREPSAAMNILGPLGMKKDEYMFKKKRQEIEKKASSTGQMFLYVKESIMPQIRERLITVLQALGLHNVQALFIAGNINALFGFALDNRPIIRDYKKFSYHSKNKKGSPSPFFTDCITIESKASLYKQCSASVNFIYGIFDHLITKLVIEDSPEKIGGFMVHGPAISPVYGSLIWRSRDGKILFSINIMQLLEHTQLFADAMLGDENLVYGFEKIERIAITTEKK